MNTITLGKAPEANNIDEMIDGCWYKENHSYLVMKSGTYFMSICASEEVQSIFILDDFNVKEIDFPMASVTLSINVNE